MHRDAQVIESGRVLRAVTLFLLLFTPLSNLARPGFVSLPFRTVRSMILVEGKIDGQRLTLLLDTGANRTIVSARSYGTGQPPLRQAELNRSGAGMAGESVRVSVNLALADHMWAGQEVSVMNLDALQEALGVRFDGLLGQDVLREFRTVRINYHSRVIELEK